MTELDRMIAIYAAFPYAFVDAVNNGLYNTVLGEEEIIPLRNIIYPFPDYKPDSDFSFFFYANNGISLKEALSMLSFSGTAEERNQILIEGKRWFDPPKPNLYNNNIANVWENTYGLNYNNVAEILQYLNM